MTFSDHIRDNIFLPRLKDNRILVIYDEHGRYKKICEGFASDQCQVIFTDRRPVSSRQDAMERWRAMAKDDTYQSQMLIHCVEPAPKDNEERQSNPFASYAAIGSSFPHPSKASDEYKMVCYGFLKDRIAEIDQLFNAEDEPTFDLIDHLAGGSHSHPHLQSIFGTADASKIIPDFLVIPQGSTGVSDELTENSSWCEEMRQLLLRTLGLKVNAKITQASSMRDKLWQYLLFSEFADDLPGSLPAALAEIPKAAGPQLAFATSLCHDLRKHSEKKEAYREAADRVEKSLDISAECQGLVDLGSTDTFAFEEKNFLAQASVAIRALKWDAARSILDNHKNSLWTEEGERKLLWRILGLGLDTMEQIKRADTQLKLVGQTGKELCDLFDAELIKVDRSYRNLEEATAQTLEGYEEIEDIIEATRKAYRTHFNELQSRFLTSVQREGWPFHKMDANIDSYNSQVAPALRDGKRVVYFLVDALRLDLAHDLESHIHGHQVRCLPACAQLPCVTRFGMASLLPDADQKLRFQKKGSDLIPFHGDVEVNTRQARMGVFESMLNDRVTTTNLTNFIDETKTSTKLKRFKKQTSQSDILVLTSTELDELGEGTSTSDLQLIPSVMRKLQLAISRCAELDYDMAVIATDHGFLWVEDTGAGSVCGKPAGEWSLSKRRCLIGQGDEAPGVLRFANQVLSIPTDEPSFIVPKALATFSKGSGYFHEGLSLQESLVPRLVIHFAQTAQLRPDSKNPEISLSRKKPKATSRIVSINISWPGSPDMFSDGTEFRLVAFQRKNEVGFPSSGDHVDSSSGLVKMKQGESIKVSLRLTGEAREGAILVKAIHPSTEKTLDTLELNFQPIVF